MREPGLLIIALSFAASGAAAHHSLAPYAMAEVKTVEGTVKNFDWSNPHVRLDVLVPDGKGGSAVYQFEGSSVGRLSSTGFRKNSLAPGDTITVAYNPRRDHTPGGFFVAIKMADGKMLATDRYRASPPEQGQNP
jgi:hypothetical protein